MAYTTIDNPELHFQTVLYTGNGSSGHAITLDGDENMQPDWVWIKSRSDTEQHTLYDSSRGSTKRLMSDGTNVEYVDAGQGLQSFDSDGFTLGENDQNNKSSQSCVAWCWKANGTGSSNTAGSINTTATSANTTSGFSIVTYTGDENSSATLGHGLGAVPKYIVTKGRTYASSWATFHASQGATKWFQGSETDAVATASTIWNDAEPTSTLFTVGSSNQVNDDYTYVAYVFAEIQGFSKFGSYTGNGNADGPFAYTGFKPAWLLIKESSGVEDWRLYDNKRSPFNVMDDQLFPNDSAAEATSSSYYLDFLSNGFKIRSSHGGYNTDDDTYIYMAFAEQPFVTSGGVPCTAR